MDCCNHQCEACHKHKERTPEEYAAQLKDTNEQLSIAVAQADRANAAKTSFLSRMSHDIRTPLNGIRGMVENSAYCPDILTQVAATSAALNAFTKELLASHIRTCVADDIRAGHDEAIDELVAFVQTLQKLMK